MIKINLLREKKKVKRASKGSNEFAVGLLGLGLAAAGVYFFLHEPLAAKIERQDSLNENVRKDNLKIREETKEYEAIKQQFALLKEQETAIERLSGARATPAWFMREIGSLLTKGHQPTMTPEMVDRIKADPTLQWNPGWDPKRVWLESLDEKDGTFTMVGGAQSDTDVTQFLYRLQASVFARDVRPGATSKETDSKTKTDYYKFTVSGKVVY